MKVHCSKTQQLLSSNFCLSYTSLVWSGKTFSRSIHCHKWCLFSYWDVWDWNGWLLFVNLIKSHHCLSCKFCNKLFPYLPDILMNYSLQSSQPHSEFRSWTEKQLLPNMYIVFRFIPCSVCLIHKEVTMGALSDSWITWYLYNKGGKSLCWDGNILG